MILPYTSCLFGTVVLHAYHKRYTGTHHAFLALTLSSIMFHTTHCELVRRLDKAIAHCVFALVLLDTPRVIAGKTGYLHLFPVCTGFLWFGMHAYLWAMN